MTECYALLKIGNREVNKEYRTGKTAEYGKEKALRFTTEGREKLDGKEVP